METTIHYNEELYLTLKKLLDQKSRRDGVEFTVYQLAKAINMPHSILIKLMHQDPVKRVNNPRIDTLAKIVGFFKADGFPVTIDDLLFKNKEIDIQSQAVNFNSIEQSIEIYSLDCESVKLGIIDINLPQEYNNVIAFLSEEDVNHFKKGSIFIVDKQAIPKNNNLVAVKIENHKKILIKKLIIDKNKRLLVSLNDDSKQMPLLPTLHYLIIGVIVHINANT